MKKLFVSLFLLTSMTSFGQEISFDKWSISYGVGGHLWTKPSSYSNMNLQNFQVSHHDINGRYMFNNRLGLMLDFGYDFFDFANLGKQNTHFIRTTLQGVVNVGDIIKLNTISKRLGILAHGGIGYGYLWQKNPAKKKDNVMNFVIGITPQIRVAKAWSIKMDASMIANYKQGYTFDFLKRLNTKNSTNNTGIFFNLSLGVTYHIGKVKNHADWTPTNYGSGAPVDNKKYDDQIAALETRIKELENHLQDDDNDGVINKRDLEKDTKELTIVNSLGQTIKKPLDTDGDGLTDDIDECPTEAGRIMGCPDKDGDGIPDRNDACPEQYGKPENQGCPLAKETMDIIKKISENTYFETNKAELKKSCIPSLDSLATILKQNPEVAIRIEGHTDNVGSSENNLKLSKERAASVRAFLISKGIDPGRISSEGYGDTRPIRENNTEEGKAKNRRVEIHTSIIEKVEVEK